MVYDYSDLRNRSMDWAQTAHAQQWITASALATLETCDIPSPAQQNANRPLLVAFMGGTGVGKSSLLNRLAGRAIAKSGIARPTSREVTLFHHRDTVLPTLPLDGVTIAHHNDITQKNRVWIDMPDFDSTDAQNRDLVLAWLAHIDILIYVVSPERYRDEKAWQLLLAQGARHAWLFVLNQWDCGQAVQADDFAQQLHQAGFNAPLIFKTSCTQSLDDDEFDALTQTLSELATQKTCEQLYLHSQKARIHALQKPLQQMLSNLGDLAAVQLLKIHWLKHEKSVAKQLQQGFAWKLPLLAEQFASHASDLHVAPIEMTLWDAWAQTRFEDALNETLLYAQMKALPTAPLENLFMSVRAGAQKTLHHAVELQTRQSLAQRGTAFQRVLLKVVGIAEIVLPLAAMSWVGYQVFDGYYESNQTHLHYLSIDFAVHSVLLCGLSWLMPFFILKKCQPSLEKSALRGLNKGIAQGIATLNASVLAALAAFEMQQQQQQSSLETLVIASEALSAAPLALDANSTLERMLVFDDR